MLDYEVDSDDEWEEEEPGESLSNSEVLIYFFRALGKSLLFTIFCTCTKRPQF